MKRWLVNGLRVTVSGGWRRLDNLIPTFYVDALSAEEAIIQARTILGDADQVSIMVKVETDSEGDTFASMSLGRQDVAVS